MADTYEERRDLVESILAERHRCEARVLCAGAAPVDVHEKKTRARTGDTARAILNRRNCLAVCRACHNWIGDHPRQARERGLVLNSWDDDPA